MIKLFTWHVHGSYLYYLSQGNYQIYIPVKKDKTEGYYGRGSTFPFGDNVIEVAAEQVRNLRFDCILFQTNTNYLFDQYEILSDEQRALPAIYLEHDTPRNHAVNSSHIIKDPAISLVHVTHYNKLMWDNNGLPATVIEHGVTDTGIRWTGELEKGLTVINNLPERGRMLGFDLLLEAREYVPVDLVGMGTGMFGSGEVLHPELPEFMSKYRFYFHPVRYTSLGLSLCEAMMAGIPVVGLATTELPSIIKDAVNGFADTDPAKLFRRMELLIRDRSLAERIGAAGRETAKERFGIKRFINEWDHLFHSVIAARAAVM